MEGNFFVLAMQKRTVFFSPDPTEGNSMQCRVSHQEHDSAAGKKQINTKMDLLIKRQRC